MVEGSISYYHFGRIVNFLVHIDAMVELHTVKIPNAVVLTAKCGRTGSTACMDESEGIRFVF
jgi:hypothetical protein